MRSEEMIKLLPSGLREVLQKMNLDVAGLQEIRLRAEQPAVILSHGKVTDGDPSPAAGRNIGLSWQLFAVCL